MEDADRPDQYAVAAHHDFGGADSPSSLRIAELHNRLENLKQALPFALTESQILTMHYHIAMVYLCHTDISRAASRQNLSGAVSWPQWRLEALTTGLVSAKHMLSFYSSLPVGSEMHFNNTEWIQLGFALTFCARFAILSNGQPIQQETAHLRSFLGMSDILKDILSRLQPLSTSSVNDEGKKNAIHHYHQRVERLNIWFEVQLIQALARNVDIDTASASMTSVGAQHGKFSLRDGHFSLTTMQSEPLQTTTNLNIDGPWRGDEAFTLIGPFSPGVIDMADFSRYFSFDTDML